jgi:serine/threonine protein kinase
LTVAPGTRLGPYEIVSPLGAGGMGEVYRARDTKLDRDVAVKVLPADLAKDPEALSRLEREARAVAQLSHPNRLERLDLASGRRILIREVAPADRTGVVRILGAALTDDTKSYAYSYFRMTSQLFVVEGAR